MTKTNLFQFSSIVCDSHTQALQLSRWFFKKSDIKIWTIHICKKFSKFSRVFSWIKV